jgi:mono/diheme cytochrome c family protein
MRRIIISLALVAAFSMTAWSEDGALIYRNRCMVCHAAGGTGKMGGQNKLVGIALSADQIVILLTKGGAPKGIHANPMATLTVADAKAVAAYVKSLK